MIKKIKQARFEALSYGRLPMSNIIGPEVGWYETREKRILGVLIYDIHDSDYSFVVLARDSDKIFRAISFETSIKSKRSAIKKLHEKMKTETSNSDESFYQDNLKEKFDIYDVKVPTIKLHSHFQILLDSKNYSPAKELIREMIFAFKDPDGNYIEQFQTNGFNSRLWELFLFGYFHENGFLFHKENSSPDFLVERARKYAIEAVTVNPSLVTNAPPPPVTNEEISSLNKDFMPIRFGSSLLTKLQKKYWEKDHVKGLPLIIAIHDFHYDNSMTWSRSALERYLYGMSPIPKLDQKGNLEVIFEEVKEHRWGNKVIPSNFFAQPDTENISAVLFTNQATLTKFNRMGFLADFGSKKIQMTRFVSYYNPDPNAVEPIKIAEDVTSTNYTEFWREDLIMFHNPNALYPIEPNEFPEISHAIFEKGQWFNLLQENFALNSFTMINPLE